MYHVKEDLEKSGDKAFQTFDVKSAGKGKYDVNGLYFGDRAGNYNKLLHKAAL